MVKIILVVSLFYVLYLNQSHERTLLLMQIRYTTSKLEKVCTNLKEAKKKYSGIVPEKLHAIINFIENASNLTDIINYIPFHFHHLKGSRKGEYAVDIGGRSSGWRLIIIPIDDSGSTCSNDEVYSKNAVNIVIVQLEEVTNHYE